MSEAGNLNAMGIHDLMEYCKTHKVGVLVSDGKIVGTEPED